VIGKRIVPTLSLRDKSGAPGTGPSIRILRLNIPSTVGRMILLEA